MPPSHRQAVLARARRLLDHARACALDRSIVWHEVEGGLGRCSTWAALAAWADALPSDLVHAPLGEYARTAAARGSAVARLHLPADRLAGMDRPGNAQVPARGILGPARDEAFSWGQEALLAWEPWAPHLDPALFQLEFDGPWPEGEDVSAVPSILARTIATDAGPPLGLQYYTREAWILEAGEFRDRWDPWFHDAGDDWLVLPLAPRVAAWAVCYFHHDALEIGRLRAPWPHVVRLPA